MLNWFRRKTPAADAVSTAASGAGPPIPPELEAARPFIQAQADYWRSDPAALASLRENGAEALSWPQRLRLHHLACVEVFRQSGDCAGEQEAGEEDSPNSAEAKLAEELAGLLLAADSPFCPRHALLWRGPAGGSAEREADTRGLTRNASVTHLGCLEAIGIDAQDRPTGLAFIPLDDVRGVLLSRPSLFRAAKILYEDGRPDQIVRLPLLYGLSWLTGRPYDTDGTLTRFCGHLRVPGVAARVGIGIGQQDWLVQSGDGRMSLVGIGAVGEVVVALEVSDPHFDQKCRARGIDPDNARNQFGPSDG